MASLEAVKTFLIGIDLIHLIIVIGALIGSVKTSYIINREDSGCDVAIDICLGLFCGIMAGYHFSNELNVYITGLISLLGGIGGAIITEVIIELLPKASKEIIIMYLKNYKK